MIAAVSVSRAVTEVGFGNALVQVISGNVLVRVTQTKVLVQSSRPKALVVQTSRHRQFVRIVVTILVVQIRVGHPAWLLLLTVRLPIASREKPSTEPGVICAMAGKLRPSTALATNIMDDLACFIPISFHGL